MMKTSDFNYHLPQELIAQHPAEKRELSRMMILESNSGSTSCHLFREFPTMLQRGDVLVINDTKVIPARLKGNRKSGAKVELFLLHPEDNGNWRCLVNPGRKVRPGDTVEFAGKLTADIIARYEDGTRSVKFSHEGSFEEAIEVAGEIPLPPYIKREEQEKADKERYQTVYAAAPGAVAAPTAGLHFTPEILETLEAKGVEIARVTLHVGMGTFKPVSAEEVADHKMDSEWFEITTETAAIVTLAKAQGRRIIAVGTTSVRTLESAWNTEENKLDSGCRWTEIFITPGYKFKAVDALLTNFHLPCSTLIMLISAMAGRENVLAAYEKAVSEKFRFYSYGDCMFIHREEI